MEQELTIEEKEIESRYGLNLKEVSMQLDEEYRAAEKFIRNWREQKRTYLKLYINQRKNPKKVGDTLMFSTHQTILASLHKDRLDADWMYREEEDEDRSDEINALWTFDYDEMGKAEHDYGKYWDASGIGVGVEDWSHFDRESLTPIPVMWDPLSTYFDPKATSINGNRLGNGASRFIGRDIVRTRQEMEDLGRYFNLDKLESDEKAVKERQLNQQARDNARGTDSGLYDDLRHNKAYPLVQWFTWIKGKRYRIEAGNERKTVVLIAPVKTDYWPLQEHRIYPDPHFLLTPGTWDFTEDKQRARATLQNYGLDAAKLDVLPMWLFDKNKIKNKQQLRDWKAGKMIEGENLDGNAIFPLTKPSVHQYVENLMQLFQSNAEKALATPEIQQGILFNQKRTATEISEASANVDSRYALNAAMFSLTEMNGAYMWFDQYKRNFKSIDKKMVRIIGAFGPQITPVTESTFKFKKDPDVRIESRAVSQARKRDEANYLASFGQVLVQTPGSNLRYFAKKMGRLRFSKDEVARLIPPTIDEMKAEKENESLSANTLKAVEIEPTDDHKTHLEIHSKAKDTKAKFAHIEAHKKAMMIQRNNPELFAGLLPDQPQPQIPGQTPPPATPQGQVAELIQ
jgi:hypothetical protein